MTQSLSSWRNELVRWWQSWKSKAKYVIQGTTDFYSITTQFYVVLQFDAEFRRISLSKTDVGTYEQFKILIERLHKLLEVPFVLSYTDPKDGDLLPINNDDNLGRAVLTAKPLLRIIIQRKGKIFLLIKLKTLCTSNYILIFF